MQLRSGSRTSDVVAERAPATEAMAEHNAASPFLQLPQEIKNMIYEYVCGGRVIHINKMRGSTHTHDDDVAFSQTNCTASTTEQDAYGRFINADPTTVEYFVESLNDRHHGCFRQTRRNGAIVLSANRVDVKLLRTCRQIYNEAKYIPYSTNTFAFQCPTVMNHFIDSLLLKSQLKRNLAMRNLLVEITVGHPSSGVPWVEALKRVVKHLKGLKRVHVLLYQICCLCWFHNCAYKHAHKNRLLGAIRALHKLPLIDATVVIDDEDFIIPIEGESPMDDPVLRESRWTLGQKQEWATETRKLLLAKD